MACTWSVIPFCSMSLVYVGGKSFTTALGPIPNIFVFLLLLRAGQGMLKKMIKWKKKMKTVKLTIVVFVAVDYHFHTNRVKHCGGGGCPLLFLIRGRGLTFPLFLITGNNIIFIKNVLESPSTFFVWSIIKKVLCAWLKLTNLNDKSFKLFNDYHAVMLLSYLTNTWFLSCSSSM